MAHSSDTIGQPLTEVVSASELLPTNYTPASRMSMADSFTRTESGLIRITLPELLRMHHGFKAKADFNGLSHSELSFLKHEVLNVLRRDTGDWWFAELGGKLVCELLTQHAYILFSVCCYSGSILGRCHFILVLVMDA